MPDNVLSAKITADGSQFTKTVGQLEKQLKTFQDALKNTSSVESFNRLNRAIDATKARLASIKSIQDPFKGVTQGSNAALQALTNTSRVAQDLPFGFLGIANNLNPLLESFQRLKVETGSTGGALKALGASLSGAGGIGLALSVVSSLLIVFGDKLFGAGARAKETKRDFEALTQTIEDQTKALQGLQDKFDFLSNLNKINLQVFTDGGDDILGLQGDVVGLNDLLFETREALNDNIDALAALRKNKSGFDLTQREKELLGVQQGFERLTLTEEQYADAEKKLQDQRSALFDKEKKQEQTRILTLANIRLKRAEQEREANKKAKDAYDKYVNDTISKAKELASFLDSRTIRNVQFTVDPRDSVKKVFEDAKKFIDSASNRFTTDFRYKINVFPQINFERDRAELFKDLPKETEKLKDALEKEIDALTKRNPILIQSAKFGFDIRRLQDQANFLAAQFDQAIRSAFINAGESLASLLGDALSGKDIGAGIFAVVGDLITQIGKALLQFGIVKQGVDKILANPLFAKGGIAIGLGLAAIAAGQLVKNLRSSGARASGGGVNAGQGYYVGERGPEYFVPNTAGRIVSNNAIGGNTGRVEMQPMVVQGRLVAEGNSLVALISSVQRSQRRLN